MTHVARGVDDEGVLTVDVVMRGQVPQLADNVHDVTVLPYTEQYTQTAPGQTASILYSPPSIQKAYPLSLSVCLSVCLSVSQTGNSDKTEGSNVVC